MSVNLKNSFLFHLGIVLALCILLYMSFFASLHCFTRHGQELTIPDVRGKNVNAAIDQLKAAHFDVYVDSTYEPAQKPLSVLKQVPDSAAIVKEGRTVFLTVNMLNPPHIPMPNLVSLSYRSAVMLLHNNKLLVGDTTYKPDIASGAILEQNYRGTSIRPGEMVAQGSKIDLVIGNGLGNTEFNVPNVCSSNVDEALVIINQYNLQPIITAANNLAKISDTGAATIVDMDPKPFNEAGVPNRIKSGDVISLYIEQDPDPKDIRCNNYAPSGVNDGNKTPQKK